MRRPSRVKKAKPGLLTGFDQQISLPFHRLPNLGFFEYLLSFPGMVFGIPLYSIGLASLAVATVAEHAAGIAGSMPGIIGVSSVLLYSYWLFCMWESKQLGIDRNNQGFVRPFQSLGRKYATHVTLSLPNITSYICSFSSETASTACRFYCALYLSTQLVIELVKASSRRTRPVVAMKSELRDVSRSLPQVQFILSQPHAANSSFPSSDAAGATSFAAACWVCLTAVSPDWGAAACGAIVAVSMFGRLYFHAHFIGDITVGSSLAAAIAYCWSNVYPALGAPPALPWSEFQACQIGVIFCWHHIQKLKPKGEVSIYRATAAPDHVAYRGMEHASRLTRPQGPFDPPPTPP